jgi:hypothetical protein
MERLTYLQRLVDRGDRLRDSLARTSAGLVTGIALILSAHAVVIQSLHSEAWKLAEERAAREAKAAGKEFPHPDYRPRLTDADVIGEIGMGIGFLVCGGALLAAITAMCNANGVNLGGRGKGQPAPEGATLGDVAAGLGPKGIHELQATGNEQLTTDDVCKAVKAAELDLREACEAQQQSQSRLKWASGLMWVSLGVSFLAFAVRHGCIPR